MTNTMPYWLALFHTPQITRSKLSLWLSHFSDIKSLFQSTLADWRERYLSEEDFHLLKNANWKAVDADLTWAEASSQHILSLDDPRYPPLLKEIYDPPFILFVKGQLEPLSERQIAIVGARNATPAGLQNATWFAKSLAELGWVITSGLARGIDGASHAGAMLAKGRTIAVCGTGLHHIYPRSHEKLAAMIQEKGGALISEFALDKTPHASHFPRRNRVISGMSLGVLVIEAAVKSGSLITARCASEQGREVFALPGSIRHPTHTGCHQLIRQGAKLVENVTDITEEFCLPSASSSQKCIAHDDVKFEHLLPNEKKIMSFIDYETTPIDMILLQSGLTIGECSSILLILELQGYIQTVSGGFIRRISD